MGHVVGIKRHFEPVASPTSIASFLTGQSTLLSYMWATSSPL